MRTYPRPLLLTAIALNVALAVAFHTGVFGQIPVHDPWTAVGALGVIVSVAQLTASVVVRSPAVSWLAGLGSVVSGIGWGSWIVVGLTAEPSDPVINVTGLLVDPGALLGLAAVGLLVFHKRISRAVTGPRTFGLAFGAIYLLLFTFAAIRYVLYSGDIPSELVPLLIFMGMLLPIISLAAGILQIVFARCCRASRQARALTGGAGVLAIVAIAFLSPLWVVCALLSFGAVVAERRGVSLGNEDETGS